MTDLILIGVVTILCEGGIIGNTLGLFQKKTAPKFRLTNYITTPNTTRGAQIGPLVIRVQRFRGLASFEATPICRL